MRFKIQQNQLSDIDKKEHRHFPRAPSEKLAEIIGILAGDGHVGCHTKYGYLIEVAGHVKDDLAYFDHVKSLMQFLFNVEMKLRIKKSINTAYLSKGSKGIVSFFYAIGYQKKNCIIQIPSWVWEKDVWTRSLIRGLFDTDGSISLKKNHGKFEFYPVVSIALKDKALLGCIATILHSQGFPLSFWNESYYDMRTHKRYTKAKIQISGYRNVTRWFQIIGSSNPKHKEKWGGRDLQSKALLNPRHSASGN